MRLTIVMKDFYGGMFPEDDANKRLSRFFLTLAELCLFDIHSGSPARNSTYSSKAF